MPVRCRAESAQIMQSDPRGTRKRIHHSLQPRAERQLWSLHLTLRCYLQEGTTNPWHHICTALEPLQGTAALGTCSSDAENSWIF